MTRVMNGRTTPLKPKTIWPQSNLSPGQPWRDASNERSNQRLEPYAGSDAHHRRGSGAALARNRRRRSVAKLPGAIRAGAHRAQIVVAENPRGVAVSEVDLDGVIAHLRRRLRARLRLEHGQHGRGRGIAPRKGLFL